jgi:acyl carrier protein
MEIKEIVIAILSAHCDKENVSQYLHENDDITKLGMNSITFISMVVDLESEFCFEFEDEALDYNKFRSLNILCSYVEEQMKMNNVVYLPNEVDMSIKIN